MINTILIVLVAVVVLIVIIAVLALHFLRADDSDTFDEIPDEPRRSRRTPSDPPPAPRELAPAAAERGRPRRSEPTREPWAGERPVRPADDHSPNYRERDTAPRPVAPDRRGSQPGGQRPAAASARPAKPPRPADQDPKSSSWDSLSDVDYWAELSADRPQITPAAAASGPAAPAGAARRSPAAKPDARPAAAARPAMRDENGQLPRRQRAQSGRAAAAPQGRPAEAGQTEQLDVRAARGSGGYSNEPATQSLAALARLGGQPSGSAPRPAGAQRPGTGQRPASGPRPAATPRPASGQRPATGPRQAQPSLPGAPAAQVSQPNGRTRPPVPLDDDPLTSPSFPAVNTSDSRSYRARRSPGGQSGPHTGPHPAGGRGAGGNGSYGEPTAQFSQYPPAAQAPSQPIMQPPAPVANPYGSYVSAPQPPYQDVAAAHPDPASYGNGYTGGWQADGTWYAGAASGDAGHGDAATGYLPAPAYNGTDQVGNGYAPVDYNTVSYQGAAYQAGPAATGPAGNYVPQGNFAGQYDQRSYGSPDLGYGQDGYQAHPGYGQGH